MDEKRMMTGRALTFERDEENQTETAELFVDVMLSEDDADLEEVAQDWTVHIEAARFIGETEFNITKIMCIFDNDTFMPPEVMLHISENYEMITELIKDMLESCKQKEFSVEYEDEPEPDETGFDDEDCDNYWTNRLKSGVNINFYA